jgi:SAM-dependent methyltransferase
MADEGGLHPRLAAHYDTFEGDRCDLDPYIAEAETLAARHVLDIGCDTGELALKLVDRGIAVTGVDPDAASLDVARAKPGADRVQWILGTAADLPAMRADLATMTANVAQAIVEPAGWAATLAGAHRSLRPGGRLMFETRVPARQSWLGWNRDQTLSVIDGVQTWCDVLDVSGPLVTFRWTWIFPDGERFTHPSTLRFRERDEVEADLRAHGFTVTDVRDAPDRPGREYVFVATKP